MHTEIKRSNFFVGRETKTTIHSTHDSAWSKDHEGRPFPPNLKKVLRSQRVCGPPKRKTKSTGSRHKVWHVGYTPVPLPNSERASCYIQGTHLVYTRSSTYTSTPYRVKAACMSRQRDSSLKPHRLARVSKKPNHAGNPRQPPMSHDF